MDQTHLISVCVFCLLCATHIHCSEFSSRGVKSKVKARTVSDDDGGGNHLRLDKLDRGSPGRSTRSSPSSQMGSIPSGKRSDVTFREFLNSSPAVAVEAMSAGAASSSSGGNVGSGGVDGRHATDASAVHSVLHDSDGPRPTSRNGIQSVNKYIKIPESSSASVRSAAEPFPGRTLNGRMRRNAERASVLDEQLYIENLFNKYRNSEDRIDLNGFKEMLGHLGLERFGVVPHRSDRPHHHHHHHHHDDDNEHINSLELRDGDGVDRVGANGSDHGGGECMTPGSLLRAVVAETRNGSAHGEKRKGTEDDSEGDEASTEMIGNGKDLYLSKSGLLKLCPFLIYQLVEPQMCESVHGHGNHEEDHLEENHHLLAWLYATASVVVVSLCGLLGVFVIPIMGHAFYQQLLQFLVALAVGSLCGDALLHLLPHAMIPHNDEAHDHAEANDHDHTSTMWKGLAVLLGIVFFFFTEKCLTLASEWRKKHQRNKKVQGHSHVQILNGNNDSDSVGEKLCKHKYSSYPYCYPDIKSNKDGHEHSRRHAKDSSKHHTSMDERALVPKWNSDAKDADENRRLTHAPHDSDVKEDEKGCPIDGEQLTNRDDRGDDSEEVSCGRKDGEYTVIIREHETSHHGHSHAHGHVHSPPETLSSVAWMVILGDGLHNFTDGMAIGAAFANNIAGGFSTAVAVFCHELPHELGDFAVLIKAGMSAKQAVFYNLISSILCFFGMCLGIFVGDSPQATSWVFAVSAGMFLYIGLVDMFPELTSSHSAIESSFCQCSLQGLGLIAGVSIMLIIAFYEDQLLTLFK